MICPPVDCIHKVLVNNTIKNNVYIEKRPQGDFAVRKPGADRASAVAPTQGEAIEIARKLNPGVAPDVERVRHTSEGKPDQWRKA
jgi:hypothetical protein